MPYVIRKDGPAATPYCVYTKGEGGSRHGCHESEEKARAQQAALYVHAPDAGKAQPALIHFGAAVKAMGGGRVTGYLCQWGNEATKDGDGEWFTDATDFDTDFPARASVYYHHGQDPAVGRQRLTHGQMERDEFGVRIDAQLDLANPRQAAIYRKVERGELGWSSGSLSHVTIPPRESPGGAIKQWPLGHDASLTWIPSDRRNLAIAIKAAPLPELEETLEAPTASLAEATERVTDTLEVLIGDYRRHAMKAGRPLSAARRERLQRAMDLIAALLAETAPREADAEEAEPDADAAPVTGSGEEDRPAPTAKPPPLPDFNDLYAALLSQEGRSPSMPTSISWTPGSPS